MQDLTGAGGNPDGTAGVRKWLGGIKTQIVEEGHWVLQAKVLKRKK
jgi:hypothetical protein